MSKKGSKRKEGALLGAAAEVEAKAPKETARPVMTNELMMSYVMDLLIRPKFDVEETSKMLDSVSVVEDMVKLEERAYPWLAAFRMSTQFALMSSAKVILGRLMELLYRKMQPEVLGCAKKPRKASKLAIIIWGRIHYFKEMWDGKSDPVCKEMMMKLMVLYLALEIVSARRDVEDIGEVITRVTVRLSDVFDGNKQLTQLAVIQSGPIMHRKRKLSLQIIRYTLSMKSVLNGYNYDLLLNALAYHLLHKLTRGLENKKKVLKEAEVKLIPATNFSSWWRHKDPERRLPLKKGSGMVEGIVDGKFDLSEILPLLTSEVRVTVKHLPLKVPITDVQGDTLFYEDKEADPTMATEFVTAEDAGFSKDICSVPAMPHCDKGKKLKEKPDGKQTKLQKHVSAILKKQQKQKKKKEEGKKLKKMLHKGIKIMGDFVVEDIPEEQMAPWDTAAHDDDEMPASDMSSKPTTKYAGSDDDKVTCDLRKDSEGSDESDSIEDTASNEQESIGAEAPEIQLPTGSRVNSKVDESESESESGSDEGDYEREAEQVSEGKVEDESGGEDECDEEEGEHMPRKVADNSASKSEQEMDSEVEDAERKVPETLANKVEDEAGSDSERESHSEVEDAGGKVVEASASKIKEISGSESESEVEDAEIGVLEGSASKTEAESERKSDHQESESDDDIERAVPEKSASMVEDEPGSETDNESESEVEFPKQVDDSSPRKQKQESESESETSEEESVVTIADSEMDNLNENGDSAEAGNGANEIHQVGGEKVGDVTFQKEDDLNLILSPEDVKTNSVQLLSESQVLGMSIDDDGNSSDCKITEVMPGCEGEIDEASSGSEELDYESTVEELSTVPFATPQALPGDVVKMLPVILVERLTPEKLHELSPNEKFLQKPASSKSPTTVSPNKTPSKRGSKNGSPDEKFVTPPKEECMTPPDTSTRSSRKRTQSATYSNIPDKRSPLTQEALENCTSEDFQLQLNDSTPAKVSPTKISTPESLRRKLNFDEDESVTPKKKLRASPEVKLLEAEALSVMSSTPKDSPAEGKNAAELDAESPLQAASDMKSPVVNMPNKAITTEGVKSPKMKNVTPAKDRKSPLVAIQKQTTPANMNKSPLVVSQKQTTPAKMNKSPLVAIQKQTTPAKMNKSPLVAIQKQTTPAKMNKSPLVAIQKQTTPAKMNKSPLVASQKQTTPAKMSQSPLVALLRKMTPAKEAKSPVGKITPTSEKKSPSSLKKGTPTKGIKSSPLLHKSLTPSKWTKSPIVTSSPTASGSNEPVTPKVTPKKGQKSTQVTDSLEKPVKIEQDCGEQLASPRKSPKKSPSKSPSKSPVINQESPSQLTKSPNKKDSPQKATDDSQNLETDSQAGMKTPPDSKATPKRTARTPRRTSMRLTATSPSAKKASSTPLKMPPNTLGTIPEDGMEKSSEGTPKKVTRRSSVTPGLPSPYLTRLRIRRESGQSDDSKAGDDPPVPLTPKRSRKLSQKQDVAASALPGITEDDEKSSGNTGLKKKSPERKSGGTLKSTGSQSTGRTLRTRQK